MIGPTMGFEDLLRTLPARPDLTSLTRDLVPPPRFRNSGFANYHPRHPSQRAAADRLALIAERLREQRRGLMATLLRGQAGRHGGIYLDGGFGVGKTHLLAALWHASPRPSAYLSFDELMYFVGIAGAEGVAREFADHRLVAIDEWELDDPGNLKMAVAVVRRLVAGQTFIATTSNTLPLDLGAGRFSQKDFRGEIEELSSAFEVITIDGEDYRHRHFAGELQGEYLFGSGELPAWAGTGAAVAPVRFTDLLASLGRVHPIRYREIVRRFEGLVVEEMHEIRSLSDALRWVHFVDTLYDTGARLAATGQGRVPGGLFDSAMLAGPFGKKLARCLSRMEELLGESRAGIVSGTIDET